MCDFTLRTALCVFNVLRNLLPRQSLLTSLWSAPLFLLVLVMMRSNACHDSISVIIHLQEEHPELCVHTHKQMHVLNVKTVGELRHFTLH